MAGLKDIDDQLDTVFGVAESEGAANDRGQGNADADQGQAADVKEPAKHETLTLPGDKQPPTGQQPSTRQADAAGRRGQPRGARDGKEGATQAPVVDLAAIRKQGGTVSHEGRVLARDAAETRLYQDAVSHRRKNEELVRQVQSLETEKNAYVQANQHMQTLGLTPVDAANAMQFMAHYRRDPVAALKNIIAEVQAAGHNLEGISGDTNFAAIQQMVQQAVAPFVGDRQATLQQQQEQARLGQELDNLIAERPWVSGQLRELDKLLEVQPNLSLRDAIHEMELYAVRHGFDLSQPLTPQVQARHAQPQQQQQQRPVNHAMQPGGRFAAADTNVAPAVGMNGSAIVPGMERTKDILRAAFRDNGIDATNF